MNTQKKSNHRSSTPGGKGRAFLRSLATMLICLTIVSLPLLTGHIDRVESKQESVSLSEHTAMLNERNGVIAEQNRAIDELEAILAYALDRPYNGEQFKTRTVTATAYTARKEECNSEPWLTASGTPSRVGVIAVSRDMEKLGIGLGDIVIIKGMGLFRVEDRMNKRWTNRVDILHANLRAARLFAKRQVEIMWLDGVAKG